MGGQLGREYGFLQYPLRGSSELTTLCYWRVPYGMKEEGQPTKVEMISIPWLNHRASRCVGKACQSLCSLSLTSSWADKISRAHN